ncbi:MAG: CPBP family intramembrane glutamic endopeptidase [Candidatus Altiarchaeota archaeon]
MRKEVLLPILAILLILLNYFLPTKTLLELITLDFILYLGIPFFVLFKVFKEQPKNFGIQKRNLKLGLKYSIILLILALPFMLYGSQLSDFKAYYPFWPAARENVSSFIYFELLIGVRMMATEFIYRGLLLFSLAKIIKPNHANLIHSFIYMLAHIGKPFLEVPYSFGAGLVFGHVDLKCKSILPSFLMHYISSIMFDAMVIML